MDDKRQPFKHKKVEFANSVSQEEAAHSDDQDLHYLPASTL